MVYAHISLNRTVAKPLGLRAELQFEPKITRADSRPTFGWLVQHLVGLLERNYSLNLKSPERTAVQHLVGHPASGWFVRAELQFEPKITRADSRPTFGWLVQHLVGLLERNYSLNLKLLERTVVQHLVG